MLVDSSEVDDRPESRFTLIKEPGGYCEGEWIESTWVELTEEGQANI
jgi:hypothetical protein